MFQPCDAPYNGNFYPMYSKIRGILNPGEYIILNETGIVERSNQPIRRFYHEENSFRVYVEKDDLLFYEALHECTRRCLDIPTEIVHRICYTLDDISEESKSYCCLSIKQIGSSCWDFLDTNMDINENNYKISERQVENLEEILTSLEYEGDKYYRLTLTYSGETYQIESPFSDITLYACSPHYKHMEGNYNRHVQFQNYNIDLDSGIVYYGNLICGFVKPKKSSIHEKL